MGEPPRGVVVAVAAVPVPIEQRNPVLSTRIRTDALERLTAQGGSGRRRSDDERDGRHGPARGQRVQVGAGARDALGQEPLLEVFCLPGGLYVRYEPLVVWYYIFDLFVLVLLNGLVLTESACDGNQLGCLRRVHLFFA